MQPTKSESLLAGDLRAAQKPYAHRCPLLRLVCLEFDSIV